MRSIEKGILSFIRDRKLVVLRDRRSDMALNVSYTEDGLKWSTNKVGKLLYYKSAFLQSGKFVGNLDKNPDVYIEHFVPRDHKSPSAQIAEYTWIKKATHLLYGHPA